MNKKRLIASKPTSKFVLMQNTLLGQFSTICDEIVQAIPENSIEKYCIVLKLVHLTCTGG